MTRKRTVPEVGKTYKVGEDVVEVTRLYTEPSLAMCIKIRILESPNHTIGWHGGFDKDRFERTAMLVELEV